MTVEISGGEFVFNGNTGKASMSKSFKPVSGNISTELIMLYPDMADGFTYALTSGGTPIVSFTTKDGKMYANGKELRSYSNYMWYMVRLYADTATQKATIKVSGKTIATDIPFASAASTLDGLYLASENNGGKTLKLDDIIVEKIVDYADYPSERSFLPVRTITSSVSTSATCGETVTIGVGTTFRRMTKTSRCLAGMTRVCRRLPTGNQVHGRTRH